MKFSIIKIIIEIDIIDETIETCNHQKQDIRRCTIHTVYIKEKLLTESLIAQEKRRKKKKKAKREMNRHSHYNKNQFPQLKLHSSGCTERKTVRNYTI